ncbi:MAG: DUF1015 domain-containing protein [Coriobacteriia bacterium]|nr:DUF1015 domain-containing protein [Coriobacteriia bacterium]MDI6844429.1 DUF1015 domain-containing protein [Anaerosomatales bacterium]
MPLVRPFQAVTYDPALGPDISALVAPPYDVIDPQMRARLLARDPRNVVAVDLPEGSDDPEAPDYRYRVARDRWRQWLSEGVLVRDSSPAFYLLEQTWEHDGRPITRRAIMAAVRIHRFDENVIIPHERTLPKAIADRLELTRACAANLSPVFGLYSDPAGETGTLIEAAVSERPLFEATGEDDVRSRLWAIRDRRAINAFQQVLAGKQVFIADGHHRYTVAIAYRDERRAHDAAAGLTPREPAYDFVLMALVNMDDPDLVVMATHRVARAAGVFDAEAFFSALGERFDLQAASFEDVAGLERVPRPAFIVATKSGDARLAVLKADVDLDSAIPLPVSSHWKSLDVAVLQELVLRPLLGIHPDEPETLDRLSFVKDTRAAFAVPGGDVAFIMRPTRMDQLKAVALAGETMPQKSTYFHPKLPTGLLFHALD